MKRILEQIPDANGNMFAPNQDQHKLYRAGWRLVKRQKNGCVWVIHWRDSVTNNVHNQGVALDIQNKRRKHKLAHDRDHRYLGTPIPEGRQTDGTPFE